MSGLKIDMPENRREWNRLRGGLEGDELRQNMSDTWRKQTGGNYRTYVEKRRGYLAHKPNRETEVQNGDRPAAGQRPVTSTHPVSTRQENLLESSANTRIVNKFYCKNCYRPLDIGNSSAVSQRDNNNHANVFRTNLVSESRCIYCSRLRLLSAVQPINRTSHLLNQWHFE